MSIQSIQAHLFGSMAAASQARIVSLPSGGVLSVRGDGCRRISVLGGSLWVTETPANGDVILRPGQFYSCAGKGLCVLQALGDSSFVLV